MEQGSTLDSKSGHDFADGDWSERTEPRGTWCSQHGYHGPCPECSPLIGFIATNVSEAAPPVWPWTPKEQWFVPDTTPVTKDISQLTNVTAAMPLVERPTLADPSLLERIRGMFPPTEAELRGRRVHEQALELAERTGVPYAEAIETVLTSRT